jgi:hypothetical protein
MHVKMRTILFIGVLSLGLNFAPAQEAVSERPATTPEEPAPDEATPTPIPNPKAAPARKSTREIDDMTDQERAAAGLDKLSPEQIEYLNQWMRNNRKAAEKKAADKAAEQAKAEAAKHEDEKAKHVFKQDAIVSRVDGTMIPLNGHTVIRLEDGTKWKQANYEDRFTPRIKERPAVAVIHTTFGFKMRIEGMPDFYVDPVRE